MDNNTDLSFFGHIEELRWHIIRSMAAMLLGAIVVGFNSDLVVERFMMAPLKSDFITYRFFNGVSHFMGGGDLFGQFDIQLKSMELSGQFSAFLWICIIWGFILVIPYILWEIWRFIEPALQQNEKKYSLVFVFATSFLFLMGVLFSYLLIVPLGTYFFYSFSLADSIQNEFTISTYVTLFVESTLAMGLVFLFPMAIYFLTKMGIISPDVLRKYRRHAFIVVLVVAGMITPADMLSMLIATIPLLILYEVSVLVAKWTYKPTSSVLVN